MSRLFPLFPGKSEDVGMQCEFGKIAGPAVTILHIAQKSSDHVFGGGGFLPSGLEFSSADLLITGKFPFQERWPAMASYGQLWPASITASRTASSRSSGTSSVSGSTQTSSPCSGKKIYYDWMFPPGTDWQLTATTLPPSLHEMVGARERTEMTEKKELIRSYNTAS